jgi:predicted nuclease of predicted toxin-antitoxin system
VATIKYYTDEHVALAVIRGLRRRGIDVVSAIDAAMGGAADLEHVEFACQQERVLFTQDADFLRLHASGLRHTGIVYARQGMPIGEMIRGLVLIQQVLDTEDMQDFVEFL